MITSIIEQYNDRDSLYGEKLTNHLNMGLFSLYKMGANEERLHEFAKGYIKYSQLPPMPEVLYEIDDENFETYLGKEGTYSSFIEYFSKKLTNERKNNTLTRFVNRLIDGEAGGAFHGIIRLAYAIELDSIENAEGELIKALAYLAEAYKRFPLKIPFPPMDPLEAVIKLSKNPYFKNFTFKRPLIIGRMTDIYEDPQFAEVLTDMPDDFYDNQVMAQLLLKLYLLTEDFTVLHGFTSTHALRVLKPYITNYTDILKQHWRLIQLAYLSTGCTSIGTFPDIDNEVESWDKIFELTISSRDVHTLKLVYSLHEQAKLFTDDRLFRIAAILKSKHGAN